MYNETRSRWLSLRKQSFVFLQEENQERLRQGKHTGNYNGSGLVQVCER